jgi:regulator of RNase E activity RraA
MPAPKRSKTYHRLRQFADKPRPLLDYATANAADAMHRIGVPTRVLDPAIRPVIPFTKMYGIAITLKLAYSDEYTGYADMYQRAYESAWNVESPILVIESPPEARFGTMGSGGAYISRHRYGIQGCILEGGARDTDDLKRMNYQVYAHFISPDHELRKVVGVSAGEPVKVGGVAIRPGDIIFGDNDGVVVIAPKDIDRVIKAMEEDAHSETEVIRLIQKGLPFEEITRRFQPQIAGTRKLVKRRAGNR